MPRRHNTKRRISNRIARMLTVLLSLKYKTDQTIECYRKQVPENSIYRKLLSKTIRRSEINIAKKGKKHLASVIGSESFKGSSVKTLVAECIYQQTFSSNIAMSETKPRYATIYCRKIQSKTKVLYLDHFEKRSPFEVT